MASKVIPEISAVLCTGCGDCLVVCQPKALALIAGKAVLARPDACEYDGGCEPVCPTHAIALPYAIVFGGSQPPSNVVKFVGHGQPF